MDGDDAQKQKQKRITSEILKIMFGLSALVTITEVIISAIFLEDENSMDELMMREFKTHL